MTPPLGEYVSQFRNAQLSFLVSGSLLSLVNTKVETPGCLSDHSLIFFFLTCFGFVFCKNFVLFDLSLI